MASANGGGAFFGREILVPFTRKAVHQSPDLNQVEEIIQRRGKFYGSISDTLAMEGPCVMWNEKEISNSVVDSYANCISK